MKKKTTTKKQTLTTSLRECLEAIDNLHDNIQNVIDKVQLMKLDMQNMCIDLKIPKTQVQRTPANIRKAKRRLAILTQQPNNIKE